MPQNRIEAHAEGARSVRRASPTSAEVFTEGTLGLRVNGGTPALEQHGTGTGPLAARAGRPRAGAAGRRHGGARPRPAAEGAPAGPPLPHADSGAAKSARGANGESAARSWPADQGTTETPPFTLDFKQSIQE